MKLREIRKARGLTQEQLAELIGLDQSTVQRAENMHSSAKLDTFVLCAEALGVGLDAMFSDERTEDEALLLQAFRLMPPQLKRSVLSLAESVLSEADAADAPETAETADQT